MRPFLSKAWSRLPERHQKKGRRSRGRSSIELSRAGGHAPTVCAVSPGTVTAGDAGTVARKALVTEDHNVRASVARSHRPQPRLGLVWPGSPPAMQGKHLFEIRCGVDSEHHQNGPSDGAGECSSTSVFCAPLCTYPTFLHIHSCCNTRAVQKLHRDPLADHGSEPSWLVT